MIKDLVMLYEKYIKNNNYDFTKEQLKVMDNISVNYKKLSNAQLCIKIAYIFNYHYEPKLIRQILSTYDDPIRAFVLFKKGTDNISRENKSNTFIFTFKKTPIFEYFILLPSFVIGLIMIGLTMIYLFLNFNNLHEIFIINNLTKLVYPILGFTMVIPFINTKLSEVYSNYFLNLEVTNKDNKSLEEERVTTA